jgi:hypothetical protein
VRLSLLFACCLALLPVLSAAAGDPTDDAFDALLSLPQAQPEQGEWNHAVPEGFDGHDGDEAALIAWLAACREEGADFGELRHQGSLLHHAIRAGLDRTALWLLAHGANPLQPLGDAPGGADALTIALQYRRTAVVDALLKRRDVRAPARRATLAGLWQAIPDSDGEATVDHLLTLKLPLPEGKDAQTLLRTALARRWYALALELTAQGVDRLDSEQPQAQGTGGALAAADVLETLDTRVQQPLFGFYAVQPADQAEVDRIWALKVRKPLTDAAFVHGLVLALLDAPRPSPVRVNGLRHLPPATLSAALSDPQLFRRWVRWSSTLAPADGEWAFTALGALPRERPAETVQAMLDGASWFREQPADGSLGQAWRRVIATLPEPLPDDVHGKLWMFVPEAQRNELLAKSYEPGDEELYDWLQSDTVERIRAQWPKLKAARPALAGHIHADLLHGCLPDARYPTWGLDGATVAKAQALLDDGAHPDAPLTLDANCRNGTAAATLSALEHMGIVQPAAAVAPDRFRSVANDCRFDANAIWRAALFDAPQVGGLDADGAQLLALPGSDQCGLLLWGGSFGGRTFFTEDDFTGTQTFSPCTDGESAAELWRIVDGRLQRSDLHELTPIGGATALIDTRDGTPLLRTGGISLGGCGETPTNLLAWNETGAAVPLRSLPREDARVQAYYSHCAAAVARTQEPPAECQSADGWALSLRDFLDRHWGAERQRYLDAVLALDSTALIELRRQPTPPHWTRDAILAVSTAPLPLADKRARTAWLFREAHLAQAVDYDSARALRPWLPAEDWTPVLRALDGKTELLQMLYDDVEQEGGNAALSCRLAKALKRRCRG